MEPQIEESMMMSLDLHDDDIEAQEANSVTSSSKNKMDLRIKKKTIIKVMENESKDSICRVGGLLKIGSFIIKVVLSYAVMIYLCAAFVFTMNIGIELILFMIDALMGSICDKLECIFVFIPIFIITLFICFKMINKCWKTCILIWYTKYDNLHIHFCGLISWNLGNVLRCVLFLSILGISIIRTMIETRSADQIMQMDDLAIFKNLTSSSMLIGGVMSIFYVICSFVWKNWIAFRCITNLKSMYKFFGLMYSIDLNVWQNVNKALNRNSEICDEMKVKFKNHKTNKAIKKRFDDLSTQKRQLCNETEIKIIHEKDSTKLSTKQKIYYWFHDKKVGMCSLSTFIKVIFALWYVTQIIVCLIKHHNIKFIGCCVLIPIVFYYILLIDQCKIKLFQYLSGYYSSNSGPSLIKVLMTIWFIVGVVFGGSQLFMDYMKITKRKEQIYDDQMVDLIDKMGKMKMEYPLCKIHEERDNILEATFFAKMVYEAPQTKVVKRAIALYNEFSGNKWEMVQKCEERFNDNTQFPVFMHLKDENDQHMIVIRGTSQKKDFYQDFKLYSEIISIKMLSKLFPITDMWPRSLIKKFVKRMSVTEGIIHHDNHYHEQVLLYIDENIVLEKDTKLIIAGHSLGGAVAHIVGAKLKKKNKKADIRTLGISNPGLVLSSEKFDIDLDILSRIGTTIIPDLDPIPKIDYSTGQVHNIQCKSSKQKECHSCHRTLFELFESCYGTPEDYEGAGKNERFRIFMEHYKSGKMKVKECLDAAEKHKEL